MPIPPRYPQRPPRANAPYADAPRIDDQLTPDLVASRCQPSDEPRTSDAGAIDLRAVFPNSDREAPIELEIGGGRGAFAIERLTVDDNVRLLGLEVRRKWATLVDRKLAALGLADRGRVFAEDARLCLPRLGPDAILRTVFMHFPDPWWKKRHEKRLVLGEGVQDEIERLLQTGGEFFLQTDVEHRFAQYRQFLDGRAGLIACGDRPGDSSDPCDPCVMFNPYGAQSPREKRAIADGLPIFRLRYKKR